MQKRFSLTVIAALMAGTFSMATAQDRGSDWGGNRGDNRGSDRGGLNCDSDGDSNRRSSLNVIGLTADQRLICFNEF
ncbi:MAG: hypothetical protein H7X91_03645, partial [Burkholderiales bacterium]|nr:hypothetical protein [Burkholderiales bacterium]